MRIPRIDLSEKEQQKLEEFVNERYSYLAKIQIEDWEKNYDSSVPPNHSVPRNTLLPNVSMYEMVKASIDKGEPKPYLGAIGGGISWLLSPTSLGMVIQVKVLGKWLNLTDYDSW